MKVSVLTRTEESGRRIIHGIYVDDENGTSEEKARKAKTAMLKLYKAPSRLCIDSEIDTRDAE
jgi:hypothetical protein